jgi:hypothetical protein
MRVRSGRNCLGRAADFPEGVIRYFFHLRVGRDFSPDELGIELPDLDTAYLEAFMAAQAMWSELLAERADPFLRSFEIADSSGRILLTLPFREVLERARKPARIPEEVRSAQALLAKTTTLAATLRAQMNQTQEMIGKARRTMQQTRAVLNRGAAEPNEEP